MGVGTSQGSHVGGRPTVVPRIVLAQVPSRPLVCLSAKVYGSIAKIRGTSMLVQCVLGSGVWRMSMSPLLPHSLSCVQDG